MIHIVVGGAGFIGNNLVKTLLKKYKVFIIDNLSNSHNENLKELIRNPQCFFINADVSVKDECEKAIESCLEKNENISEYKIWHLAANSNIPSGIKDVNIDFKDTFLTTFNLLEACKIFNLKNFYFASSSAIYGDHGDTTIHENLGPLKPISNYGAMKLASEAVCFSSKTFLENLIIFRFPNVVGAPATHGVIFDFINKLILNPNTLDVLGDGTQQKAYLHVSDLIDAMIFLVNKSETEIIDDIYNIGPNKDMITVKEIAEQVIEEISNKAEIKYGIGNKGWVGDVPKFLYDTYKINKEGWTPKLNSKQAINLAIKEISNQLLER